MAQRGIKGRDVDLVIGFGREVHVRGLTIYAVGRNEVVAARKQAVDLSACEGLHVLCARDGVVVTTYRNRDLSGLRKGAKYDRRPQSRPWSTLRRFQARDTCLVHGLPMVVA